MVSWSSLVDNIPGVDYGQLDLIRDYVAANQIRSGLAAAVALLATYGVYKKLAGKKYNLPPGPSSWPVLGNTLELLRTPKTYDLLTDWGKKYGDIYLMYFGTTPTVILNSMDVAKEAYIQQGVLFADRPNLHTFDVFFQGGKDIFFGNYSEMWKLKRKIALGAIRQYAQGKHIDKVMSHSMEKVSHFIKKQDGPFDPSLMTKLLVYNIIGVTCFGKMYEEADDPFIQKAQRYTDEFVERVGLGLMADFIPVFKYLPSKARQFVIEIREYFIDYMVDELRQHKETFDPDNVSDFTSLLIAKQKEAEEHPEDRSLVSEISDLELAFILLDVFFAGIDTTRTTLHWFVAYMVAYPDVQTKLQQELDQILGGRPVSAADKESLHYTNAVIHEVMRIRPIAFMGIPHNVRSDTKINGYDIPKGTQVMTNTWGIHYDERHWKNASEFRPERWLTDSGVFLYQQNGYLPFSLGRRNCIGESLAKVDILMSVASLFQKMSIEFSGEGAINLEPKMAAQVIEPNYFEVTVKVRE